MNTIKTIVYYVLYAIISIVKFPFGLLGWLMLWIEGLHCSMLGALVEWAGDETDVRTWNAVVDVNIESYKSLAERMFTPMKIEL